MSDDTSEDAAEFRCLVPFPDGSDSFVNGFEAGMIWQRLMSGEHEIAPEVAVHRENETVFKRMADAQGYDVNFEPCCSEWTVAQFTKRPKRFGVIDGGRQ
ncbi:hypothetical protein GCM10007908_03210 [Rhizobium albus]|nr:hypothetical protein GCM10007908_03210 [Rhizobium albus]